MPDSATATRPAGMPGATGTGAADAARPAGPFDLVSTPYGRTLLGKLLFVVIVLTMGFYNWRRLSRRLEAPAASRELLRSAAVELTATTLVLLMTSILVAIPPPAHAAHPDGGAAATQPQPPSAEQPR